MERTEIRGGADDLFPRSAVLHPPAQHHGPANHLPSRRQRECEVGCGGRASIARRAALSRTAKSPT